MEYQVDLLPKSEARNGGADRARREVIRTLVGRRAHRQDRRRQDLCVRRSGSDPHPQRRSRRRSIVKEAGGTPAARRPEEVQQTLAGAHGGSDERVRRGLRETLEPSFPRGSGAGGGRRIWTERAVPLFRCRSAVAGRIRQEPASPREHFRLPAGLVGLRTAPQPFRAYGDGLRYRARGQRELTISLLDRRFLAGRSGAVSSRFRTNVPAFQARRGPALARSSRVWRKDGARSTSDTIYHLEPNVKETPGGLRDLQTTRWL